MVTARRHIGPFRDTMAVHFPDDDWMAADSLLSAHARKLSSGRVPNGASEREWQLAEALVASMPQALAEKIHFAAPLSSSASADDRSPSASRRKAISNAGYDSGAAASSSTVDGSSSIHARCCNKLYTNILRTNSSVQQYDVELGEFYYWYNFDAGTLQAFPSIVQ